MSYTITAPSFNGFIVTDERGHIVLRCARLWIALQFVEKKLSAQLKLEH
jgi:hypothetical protein